jgi:hypothetical protein
MRTREQELPPTEADTCCSPGKSKSDFDGHRTVLVSRIGYDDHGMAPLMAPINHATECHRPASRLSKLEVPSGCHATLDPLRCQYCNNALARFD